MFHVKKFTSKNQKFGLLGEDIAVRFLKNKGFSIIERNYTKKFGEIDIISRKDNILFFTEVKSVSRDLSISMNVFEAYNLNEYRPEDMVHYKKRQRLKRTIQTYLFSFNKIGEKTGNSADIEWQFNILCVYIDTKTRRARVKVLSDIIL